VRRQILKMIKVRSKENSSCNAIDVISNEQKYNSDHHKSLG